MTTQQQKADAFQQLHSKNNPLILFNIWDAWSARTVAASGAKALASSSWAVAHAQGLGDGEKVPFEMALSNARAISQASDLPVSIDIERGYGASPQEVSRNLASTIEAGAVGCNIEDSTAQGSLRAIDEQAERIRACRKTAQSRNLAYFINARTDVFFTKNAAPHDAAAVSAALERARAYEAAGASGIFVPGLLKIDLLSDFCRASPLPVNVMLGDLATDLKPLIAAGVSRISYGPAPYLRVLKALQESAKAVFA